MITSKFCIYIYIYIKVGESSRRKFWKKKALTWTYEKVIWISDPDWHGQNITVDNHANFLILIGRVRILINELGCCPILRILHRIQFNEFTYYLSQKKFTFYFFLLLLFTFLHFFFSFFFLTLLLYQVQYHKYCI